MRKEGVARNMWINYNECLIINNRLLSHGHDNRHFVPRQRMGKYRCIEKVDEKRQLKKSESWKRNAKWGIVFFFRWKVMKNVKGMNAKLWIINNVIDNESYRMLWKVRSKSLRVIKSN